MIKLKQIADTGRAVICSIHQPRSDLFTLFDHIVLLVRGGKIAYSGSGKSIVGYCQQIGLPMPELSNPSEYALDISSIDLRNAEAER